MRALFSAFLGAAMLFGSTIPVMGSLVTLETRQSTSAVICTDGSPLCAGGTISSVNDTGVDEVVHSNNFDGNLTTPSEARTAARSGPLEIAANASLVNRDRGPFQNYSDVSGDALFEWDVLVLNEGDVSFTFNLPPGFVEIQSNAEWGDIIELTAALQADIQYCSPLCDYSPVNDSLFQSFSRLEGGFHTYELDNNAVSVNPSLDTSSLTHDNVTQTGGGFFRTYTWDYDAFTGQIPLGHFVGGQTFSLSYRMIGEVYSRSAISQRAFGGFQTWAAAAINDPFFLSSDPLPQQSLVAFHFTPSTAGVPEPGASGLIAAGVFGTVLSRARARRKRNENSPSGRAELRGADS
jgi:hypothetical protein